MKLPYDVLLHVISLSRSAKDGVSLMATCRVLYHEGPKIALKRPVVISTAEQLDSFLEFLRADNSSRCRYLKHLELRPLDPNWGAEEELIETLPLLINLEVLRLDGVNRFLDFDADNLIPALCSITTLRYINFTRAGGLTCALLRGLRSPVVSAHINFLPDDEQNLYDCLSYDDWEQSHPTILLGNLANTLEKLQCVAWQTDEDTIIPEKVYPNMRKLSIEFEDFPLRIDPFIRAFPNLTDLYVNTEYHDGNYSESMLESHETNVAQQLYVVDPCGTWEHLEHFCGCLFDLYAIGLTSHISRVTIVDILHDGERTGMLATVLRYARPAHLKLEGITGTMLGDADQGFIAMLRDASASSLINLDVRVYFKAEDRWKNVGGTIVHLPSYATFTTSLSELTRCLNTQDDLVSALIRLPLKFLQLEFFTRDLNPTPDPPEEWEREYARYRGRPEPRDPMPASPTEAEYTLLELDMDKLIARLEAIPSLEAAHVVLPCSRGGNGFRWDDHDRTITKGASRFAGPEQWESWYSGTNRYVSLRWDGYVIFSHDRPGYTVTILDTDVDGQVLDTPVAV